jgi:hypothetical protein
VSIKQFLLISAPIGYGTLGLLAAWTFWYCRAKRQAEAPQAEAPQAAVGPAG